MTRSPRMSVPRTALSGFPARQRLFELGVTEAIPREAARIGYSHAAGCTSHDPRNLPGTLAWGKGTGALRDLLKPSGWTADSDSNLESVAHPTNSHAIALAAGTADTGREDGRPRTRTPKGPATSRVVKR